MIIPLLPFYAQRMGASDLVIGLLLSSYAICQFLAGPILGRLSDHYGRKPLLMLSQAGTLAGFILLAAANALWLVFVARIVDGITAGNISLAQAYISDVTPPEKRAQSFGMIIGIAFGIGFTIGPGISAELARFGYVYPILAACCLSFCSILCTAFLLPRNAPTPEGGEAPGPVAAAERPSFLNPKPYFEFFRRPELRPLLLQFLCFALSFSAFFSGFALFAQARLNYGVTQVGHVLLAVGLLGILVQGRVLGRLVATFGEVNLSRGGFLLSGLAGSAVALARSTPSLIAATGALSVGSGLVRPSVTALITHKAARYEQGAVLGVTQSLQSIAQILAPPLATGLIGAGRLDAFALLAGGFMFAGLAFSLTARGPMLN